MTRKALDTAIEEARRFLAKAEALRDREDGKDKESVALRVEEALAKKEGRQPYALRCHPAPVPPMAAAVKRASLDLTRALAALRRPE